jgi:hypothetical protein
MTGKTGLDPHNFGRLHCAALALGDGRRTWEPSPNELIKLRHLARDGATAKEIKEKMGWSVSLETVYNRLKKYHVPILADQRAQTGLKPRASGIYVADVRDSPDVVNGRHYRPGELW